MWWKGEGAASKPRLPEALQPLLPWTHAPARKQAQAGHRRVRAHMEQKQATAEATLSQSTGSQPQTWERALQTLAETPS